MDLKAEESTAHPNAFLDQVVELILKLDLQPVFHRIRVPSRLVDPSVRSGNPLLAL